MWIELRYFTCNLAGQLARIEPRDRRDPAAAGERGLNDLEQWLVADGRNIWSYDLDLMQVTVKPQADALANTPALLLGCSGEAMDQFEYDGSFVEGGLTWVRLLPVDTDSGFRRVELGFDTRLLSRMVFFDNLEQTTVVVLKNVAVNEPIDAARFEFAVPDDVDVVGKPVAANLPAD